MDRKECLEAVSRPGKFEGEQPYAPYYYDIFLDGCAADDDGDVLKFKVTAEDRELFPELKGKRSVSFRETDQGFFVEC